jgi:hypothetical protein
MEQLTLAAVGFGSANVNPEEAVTEQIDWFVFTTRA